MLRVQASRCLLQLSDSTFIGLFLFTPRKWRVNLWGPLLVACSSSSIVRANSAKALGLNLQWVRPFHCIQWGIAGGFRAPPGTKSKLDLGARNFGLWTAFWFERKSFSPGLCFVILLCATLGLFAMQHVLRTDTSIKVARRKQHWVWSCHVSK